MNVVLASPRHFEMPCCTHAKTVVIYTRNNFGLVMLVKPAFLIFGSCASRLRDRFRPFDKGMIRSKISRPTIGLNYNVFAEGVFEQVKVVAEKIRPSLVHMSIA
jgi:hypothetical protein